MIYRTAFGSLEFFHTSVNLIVLICRNIMTFIVDKYHKRFEAINKYSGMKLKLILTRRIHCSSLSQKILQNATNFIL